MIVNTASKCGNTITTKILKQRTKNTKTKVCDCGFSSEHLPSQEPGTNEEIATFVRWITVLLFQWWIKSCKGDDMAIYQFWLKIEKWITRLESRMEFSVFNQWKRGIEK
jgi:glutathione peroxidase-family protein